MLHEFLTTHREEILARARDRLVKRTAPRPTQEELTQGIPTFFDELIVTLRGGERRKAIARDASRHGEQRQRVGFTVAQLVHDYGDLCQAITHLAIDLGTPIGADEYKTLNACLDNAIADAVTRYSKERERKASDADKQRLGFLAHELRNHLQTASLSFDALQAHVEEIAGSTGAILGRSLGSLRDLVDRALTKVRLDEDVQHRESIEFDAFMEEAEAAATLQAKHYGKTLSLERQGVRGESVTIVGDRQLLGAAVANLLQNAFKFTRAQGHVILGARVAEERVSIEVKDECGGKLSDREIEALLGGSKQVAPNESGLGLGLSITKQTVESMGGVVRAHTVAGVGCVFTIDLPRAR